ncbi:MAG: hypothetical protein IPL91_14610 [Hyphomicrobium sp.]|nr:hypothetical protein [Hyphomicrobium sp.]
MSLQSGKALVVLIAVLVSWVGVFALRATEFGGTWAPITTTGWLVLLAWITLFSAGYGLGLVPITVKARSFERPPAHWFDRWILRLSIASGIGALLIIYDFAFLRGYGFDTPVEFIRQSEVNNFKTGTSVSFVSGIGRIMAPAILVGWILAMFRCAPLRRRSWILLIAATLVVLVEQTLFEGGRLFVACTIFSAVIAWLLRPNSWQTGSRPRRRTSPLALISVASLAIVMFGAIFVNRIDARGVDLIEGYAVFAENFSISVPHSVADSLQGPGAPVKFVTLMFWMYMTQGPNEFDNILKDPPSRHAYGALEFSQAAQAVSRIFGLDITYNVFEHMPNPGTYTTYLGPSFLDFGLPVSLLIAFLFGCWTCLSVRALSNGIVGPMSLCAPVLVTIALFSPIISMVLNMWLVIVFAALIGYSWRMKRRSRTTAALPVPAAAPAQS